MVSSGTEENWKLNKTLIYAGQISNVTPLLSISWFSISSNSSLWASCVDSDKWN